MNYLDRFINKSFLLDAALDQKLREIIFFTKISKNSLINFWLYQGMRNIEFKEDKAKGIPVLKTVGIDISINMMLQKLASEQNTQVSHILYFYIKDGINKMYPIHTSVLHLKELVKLIDNVQKEIEAI